MTSNCVLFCCHPKDYSIINWIDDYIFTNLIVVCCCGFKEEGVINFHLSSTYLPLAAAVGTWLVIQSSIVLIFEWKRNFFFTPPLTIVIHIVLHLNCHICRWSTNGHTHCMCRLLLLLLSLVEIEKWNFLHQLTLALWPYKMWRRCRRQSQPGSHNICMGTIWNCNELDSASDVLNQNSLGVVVFA